MLRLSLLSEFYYTGQEVLLLFVNLTSPPPQLTCYFRELFFFPRGCQVKVLSPLQAHLPVQTALPQPWVLPCACLGSGCRIRLPDGPQAVESLRKVLSHLTTLPVPAKGKDNFCFQFHFQWSRIVHPAAENHCIFRFLVIYTLSFSVLVFILF